MIHTVEYDGGVPYINRDVLLPAPRLIVYRDDDYWCPVDGLLSGITRRVVLRDELVPFEGRLTGAFACFIARQVERAARERRLPEEQTESVQYIAVSQSSGDANLTLVVDPQELAEFLRRNEGLSVPAEGDILHRFEL